MAIKRYSSTLSLTSALHGVGWLAPRPGRFTLEKETLYPFYRRQSGAQGRPRRVRKPVRRKSLYRLNYRRPHFNENTLINANPSVARAFSVWGPNSSNTVLPWSGLAVSNSDIIKWKIFRLPNGQLRYGDTEAGGRRHSWLYLSSGGHTRSGDSDQEPAGCRKRHMRFVL